MSVVVFFSRGPLWLNNVKRSPDGSVKSGYVINGDWNFEVRGGEHLAKDGRFIVNRWPAEPLREVEVTAKFGYHQYNEAIAWASAQL